MLQKKQETDEGKENILVRNLVSRLEKILKKTIKKEKDVEIRKGPKTAITLVQSLKAIIYYLKPLINTSESAALEEEQLKNLEKYWLVVREALNKGDAKKVTKLFGKLNVVLADEARARHHEVIAINKVHSRMETDEAKEKAAAKKQRNAKGPTIKSVP